jgi:hypothetical protein
MVSVLEILVITGIDPRSRLLEDLDSAFVRMTD